MKKLSKQQVDERERLGQRLETLFDRLESAMTDFNKSVAELWGFVDAAQAAYNSATQDAQMWCEDVAAEIQ